MINISLPTQIVPDYRLPFYKHSQVINSVQTVVLMVFTATVQANVYPALCSNKQCAFTCVGGLTADNDEGIDDTACHFVVGKKKDCSDLFKQTFVFVAL